MLKFVSLLTKFNWIFKHTTHDPFTISFLSSGQHEKCQRHTNSIFQLSHQWIVNVNSEPTRWRLFLFFEREYKRSESKTFSFSMDLVIVVKLSTVKLPKLPSWGMRRRLEKSIYSETHIHSLVECWVEKKVTELAELAKINWVELEITNRSEWDDEDDEDEDKFCLDNFTLRGFGAPVDDEWMKS